MARPRARGKKKIFETGRDWKPRSAAPSIRKKTTPRGGLFTQGDGTGAAGPRSGRSPGSPAPGGGVQVLAELGGREGGEVDLGVERLPGAGADPVDGADDRVVIREGEEAAGLLRVLKGLRDLHAREEAEPIPEGGVHGYGVGIEDGAGRIPVLIQEFGGTRSRFRSVCGKGPGAGWKNSNSGGEEVAAVIGGRAFFHGM